MLMSARRTFLFALLCASSLSACGFRLAGTELLPPQLATIYLQAENFDERQRRELRRTLEAAGARLVTQADAQAARLSVILKERPDRQLATSASSGDNVKRVSRGLVYSARDAEGNFIWAPRTLKQQRDITLDDNNLLASNRERDTAVRELEQALYDQMVRQLSRP